MHLWNQEPQAQPTLSLAQPRGDMAQPRGIWLTWLSLAQPMGDMAQPGSVQGGYGSAQAQPGSTQAQPGSAQGIWLSLAQSRLSLAQSRLSLAHPRLFSLAKPIIPQGLIMSKLDKKMSSLQRIGFYYPKASTKYVQTRQEALLTGHKTGLLDKKMSKVDRKISRLDKIFLGEFQYLKNCPDQAKI